MRFKQCAILILKILGYCWEIKFLAKVTFDALSVTIPINFLTPISCKIFKISSESFLLVWCSSDRSWRQYKYCCRFGVKITKFHNDYPVGDVQPSNAIYNKLLMLIFL